MKQTLGSLDYWVGLDSSHWWRWGWTRGFSKDLHIKSNPPSIILSHFLCRVSCSQEFNPLKQRKTIFSKEIKRIPWGERQSLAWDWWLKWNFLFQDGLCPPCLPSPKQSVSWWQLPPLYPPFPVGHSVSSFSPNINRHPKIIRHLSQIYKTEEKEQGNNEKKCS